MFCAPVPHAVSEQAGGWVDGGGDGARALPSGINGGARQERERQTTAGETIGEYFGKQQV